MPIAIIPVLKMSTYLEFEGVLICYCVCYGLLLLLLFGVNHYRHDTTAKFCTLPAHMQCAYFLSAAMTESQLSFQTYFHIASVCLYHFRTVTLIKVNATIGVKPTCHGQPDVSYSLSIQKARFCLQLNFPGLRESGDCGENSKQYSTILRRKAVQAESV